MILSKSGTKNPKPGPATDRGQTGQRVAESAAREALEEPRWPRFRGRTGAAAPVLWARVCPLALLPLVPINTSLGFSERKYTESCVVLW